MLALSIVSKTSRVSRQRITLIRSCYVDKDFIFKAKSMNKDCIFVLKYNDIVIV